jgi:hypothetical protein
MDIKMKPVFNVCEKALTTQAGGLTSFTSGNENTSTPITNSNILWGAIAVAEWQKKREEEEKQRQSERTNPSTGSGQGTAGRKKYEEKMRMKRIVGESQALLDKKYAEQQAQKKVQENVHKHLMNEHRDQQSVYKSNAQNEQEKQNAFSAARWAGIAQIEQEKEKAKVNIGGSKALASPAPQDPEPPESSWWDLLNPFWYFSDEPWPWETKSTTAPNILPTPQVFITHAPTSTPTLTLTPNATPTRTPVVFNPSLYDFGIETNGVSSAGQEILLSAANLTAKKLTPYIPNSNGIPSQAFLIVMGEFTLFIDPLADIDEYDGVCLTTRNSPVLFNWKKIFAPESYEAIYEQEIGGKKIKTSVIVNTPQTIICKEIPDEPTLIHEFNHVMINHQTTVRGINVYDLTQPIQLDDGTYIDSKDGYWIRQEKGFLKGLDSWMHKPFDGDWTSGFAKIEHQADMFLNGVYDGTGSETYGFTIDDAGKARRQEFDQILKSIFGQ